MRLVHKIECDALFMLVRMGDLCPERSKLGIGRAALAHNGTIPASIVVSMKMSSVRWKSGSSNLQVNDAKVRTGLQAGLNKSKVLLAAIAIQDVRLICEILPCDGETERVESVVFDEMVHLGIASLAGRVCGSEGAGSICAATKVEPGDVDAGVRNFARAG